MKLDYIPIGRIVNAHGTRGEIRVLPMEREPSFLTKFDTFYLDGYPVKPQLNQVHKSFVLMKFPAVQTRNEALELKGKTLFIRRADASLGSLEAFDQELLGVEVCNADNGEILGIITEVEDEPAGKVYTIRGEREYLVPAIPEVFIKSLNLESNRMTIHLLEGMATDED